MKTREPFTSSQLDVGTCIGELHLTPSKGQIFMFSAITWNRHRIHYDKDQAISEGFPDVAVQRGLIGNYIARLLTTWVGNRGRIQRLEWRVKKSAFPGRDLCCSGRIFRTAKTDEGTTVICDLQVLDADDDLVADGNATVRFPHAIAGEVRV